MKLKGAQLCMTHCNLMNCVVHGILHTWILEWVAFPFSRGSSQPKNQIRVSCIAGGIFTSWAARDSYFCYITNSMVNGQCWYIFLCWQMKIDDSRSENSPLPLFLSFHHFQFFHRYQYIYDGIQLASWRQVYF